MKEKYKIALLPGDGIGPEVVREAVKILKILESELDLVLEMDTVPVGGSGYEASGHPLPEASLTTARNADAVLLGAVGGPKWEKLDFSLRPERALLGLRSSLKLYANLRPAKIFPALVEASTLKREVVEGLDILVVRIDRRHLLWRAPWRSNPGRWCPRGSEYPGLHGRGNRAHRTHRL